MPVTSGTPAIRPFTSDFPEAELEDLRARIKATRFPEKETVDDQSQGTQLATIKELARYWATEYDWRKVEARLNAYPQFITEIDGLDIHFIHVRSQHENALPVIVTHGWPGSVVEQLKIIEPLTNPTAHGGEASDAFHVVIPSMPGYGFSGKPTSKGWDPEHIAGAWGELMKRLGYTKYVAQGGDWGAVVTDLMGVQEPEGLVGIHTNMPKVIPPAIEQAIIAGSPLPSDVVLANDEEKRAVEQLDFVYRHVYYAYMMGSRPQSLTALADSPVGLAAFLLDHDKASLELITRSFNGVSEGLTRDDVLDNITLFWLTNTAISAAASTRRTRRRSSVRRASSSRSPSASSPTSSTRPPRAGRSRRTRTSSTTTGSTRAGTSQPGSSRSSSSRRFVQASGHFARRTCPAVSTRPRVDGGRAARLRGAQPPGYTHPVPFLPRPTCGQQLDDQHRRGPVCCIRTAILRGNAGDGDGRMLNFDLRISTLWGQGGTVRWLVSVTDTGTLFCLPGATELIVSGLVTRLSRRWGSRTVPGRKVIWAEQEPASAPSHTRAGGAV
ncbi:epoxide hydrolase family protein [Streptomyces sp. NPDC101234]|uniref:epoxide hydrolase family protein n=1 Tax=Streptomyces sp. NPDC101234 TaxID=3366138 RepID=UPI0037FF3135